MTISREQSPSHSTRRPLWAPSCGASAPLVREIAAELAQAEAELRHQQGVAPDGGGGGLGYSASEEID